MYPDASLVDALDDPFDSGNKRMILNLITTSLYIGLPLIWSAMMAWAGKDVIRSLHQITGQTTARTPPQGLLLGKWTAAKPGKK